MRIAEAPTTQQTPPHQPHTCTHNIFEETTRVPQKTTAQDNLKQHMSDTCSEKGSQPLNSNKFGNHASEKMVFASTSSKGQVQATACAMLVIEKWDAYLSNNWHGQTEKQTNKHTRTHTHTNRHKISPKHLLPWDFSRQCGCSQEQRYWRGTICWHWRGTTKACSRSPDHSML